MWIKERPIRWLPPNRVLVSVPSRFHKSWMELNFRETIRVSARTVLKGEPEIEFHVIDQSVSGGTDDRTRDGTRTASLASVGRPADDSSRQIHSGKEALGASRSISSAVNKAFTFDRIVVGPSNRIAWAAALAVSEWIRPGESPAYNPLVIYGTTGLGKTLLLQSCYWKLRLEQKRRPLYLTCEDFANHALEALKTRTLSTLLESLMSFDALIIDDVHFLSGKNRLQEEFCRLLNDYRSSEKQIIVSCNCPPRAISGLSARLLACCKMGLIAKLDEPGIETKIGIIRSKTADMGCELPADIAELIAQQFTGNPRTLEGTLRELLHLPGSRGSLDTFLRNLSLVFSGGTDLTTTARPTPASVSIPDIRSEVASYFKLRTNDMLSSSRERSLVYARQIGMYLARELTHHSLEEIGSSFGGRDHATVHYGIRKIRRRAADDPSVTSDLETLKQRLHGH